MQSGSLYLSEFIFGATGATCTASSMPGSTARSSLESQGSKPSLASISGIADTRPCKKPPGYMPNG